MYIWLKKLAQVTPARLSSLIPLIFASSILCHAASTVLRSRTRSITPRMLQGPLTHERDILIVCASTHFTNITVLVSVWSSCLFVNLFMC
ncbi:hypothetical protein Y032_0010g1154 [Ancylostoma ceylanicum]|nr:hypothetical protein Y032_0010g1154 [Ancylostoma ceylanicum]